MRLDCKQLIVEYANDSAILKIDIHTVLWKNYFYAQIEEFRRKIQKIKTSIKENRLDSIIKEKLMISLIKYSSLLQVFLDDSLKFYQDIQTQVKLSVY
jgi:hypothetical protein